MLVLLDPRRDLGLPFLQLARLFVILAQRNSPRTTRVAVLRDRAVAAGPAQFGAIQTAASSFGMEVSPINVHDTSEIERAVTAFARPSNGGLIVTGSPLAQLHRDLNQSKNQKKI